jgi:hypothetical protein
MLPEYGGSCALEGVPGQVAVKASGSVSERSSIKGCNDVAVDGFMGSVKLVVSLLPSAFRLLSMGMRTKKQPMRHQALLPQKFRWHAHGKPKVRVDSRKAGPFIQATVSLSRMCAVSQIFRFPRRRCR